MSVCYRCDMTMMTIVAAAAAVLMFIDCVGCQTLLPEDEEIETGELKETWDHRQKKRGLSVHYVSETLRAHLEPFYSDKGGYCAGDAGNKAGRIPIRIIS
nr:unnamed protein product [Callosobruchus chinensis]